MITLENIFKYFDETPVLKNINLSFQKGTINVIIGPSGSGKSTLLRTVNFLEPPTEGNVWIEGERMDEKPKTLQNLRQNAPMVFQSFNLFNHLNVHDNCTLAQRAVLRKSKKEAGHKAMRTLEKVGMASYWNRKPKQLSGGQKQRVSIARALSMEPRILLFDEPTSALDPEMVGGVLSTIRNVAEEQPDLTILLVTHEMAFARQIADRVLFMDLGEVIEDRKGADIFKTPLKPRTAQFLSSFQ